MVLLLESYLARVQLLFQCDSVLRAVISCLFFGVSYVGSLYIWRTGLPRDDPATIRRRSLSAVVVSLLAPILLLTQAHQSEDGKGSSLLQYLGIRQTGLLTSLCLPLLLTMILFLGPLYMMILSDIRQYFPISMSLKKWWSNSRVVATSVRNYIVGPITEEIVFRSCMLPLLVPCVGNTSAIFICPFFFGVAHVHHVIENVRLGVKKPQMIWLDTIFQFFYTTVFGTFSAFIFLRTGHLIASIITHMFCNIMGFPAFDDISRYSRTQQLIIWSMFIVGLLLFFALLFPITTPELYGNQVYLWS
ncbi:CAAX prenyl protease 2-like [Asterias amurensis]|uniref:CAAX prenyl protease 2-like n=1 Tax=Asterias amurensis TaxID=7602 RepID=UPI003AB33FCB